MGYDFSMEASTQWWRASRFTLNAKHAVSYLYCSIWYLWSYEPYSQLQVMISITHALNLDILQLLAVYRNGCSEN